MILTASGSVVSSRDASGFAVVVDGTLVDDCFSFLVSSVDGSLGFLVDGVGVAWFLGSVIFDVSIIVSRGAASGFVSVDVEGLVVDDCNLLLFSSAACDCLGGANGVGADDRFGILIPVKLLLVDLLLLPLVGGVGDSFRFGTVIPVKLLFEYLFLPLLGSGGTVVDDDVLETDVVMKRDPPAAFFRRSWTGIDLDVLEDKEYPDTTDPTPSSAPINDDSFFVFLISFDREGLAMEASFNPNFFIRSLILIPDITDDVPSSSSPESS